MAARRLACLALALATGCSGGNAGPSAMGDPRPDGDGVGETGSALPMVCGNGVREPSEACDDGDEIWGDGCNPDCSVGGSVRWQQLFPDDGDLPRTLLLAQAPGEGLRMAYDLSESFGVSPFHIVLHATDDAGAPRWSREFPSPAGDSRTLLALEFAEGRTFLAYREELTDTRVTLALDAFGEEVWRRSVPSDDTGALRLRARGGELLLFRAGVGLSVERWSASTGDVLESQTLVDQAGGGLLVGAFELGGDGVAWATAALPGEAVSTLWKWPVQGEATLWGTGASRRITDLEPRADGGMWALGGSPGLGYASLTAFDATGAVSFEVNLSGLGFEDDIYYPESLLFSALGDVVGTDYYNGTVLRHRPDGSIRWASSPGASGVTARQLVDGAGGRLFVAGFTTGPSKTPWLAELAP